MHIQKKQKIKYARPRLTTNPGLWDSMKPPGQKCTRSEEALGKKSVVRRVPLYSKYMKVAIGYIAQENVVQIPVDIEKDQVDP